MKRHFLITVLIAALMFFLAFQIYMIHSIWKQKEEILFMRYKTLSREALTILLTKKKANGFEKAMDVTDKFTELVIGEQIPLLHTEADTVTIRKEVLSQVYKIIEKNEHLSGFIRDYIEKYGYDSKFETFTFINPFTLITDDGDFVIYDTIPPPPRKTMIVVNSFKEEHNNFVIGYTLLIDLTRKNEMVFREASFSFALISASILIVLIVFWVTWKNLAEERRLSDLKTDFINNMTHELKTPLSTITVAGRTLEKNQVLSDPGKVLETAKLIGKQSVHLNQLINTILEVSLLERTEFELDKHKVNPEELIHQIIAAFLTSCDGCAVIEEEYRTSDLTVQLDILYFTTMINNLLANAVKYCETDPVIKVSAVPEGGNLVVSVSDNGIGISREHLDHIFEKFYRITHGNIHKTKGLGLGLYYVRRIATAHGGDVSVTSKPGRGTTFRISIPQ
jgi:signal transduction histidine kinase